MWLSWLWLSWLWLSWLSNHFRYQRSTVQILSSSNFISSTIIICMEKTNVQKKKPEMAHLKTLLNVFDNERMSYFIFFHHYAKVMTYWGIFFILHHLDSAFWQRLPYRKVDTKSRTRMRISPTQLTILVRPRPGLVLVIPLSRRPPISDFFVCSN